MKNFFHGVPLNKTNKKQGHHSPYGEWHPRAGSNSNFFFDQIAITQQPKINQTAFQPFDVVLVPHPAVFENLETLDLKNAVVVSSRTSA